MFIFQPLVINDFFTESLSALVRTRKMRNGLPTAMTLAGISLLTRLFAPIILPLPMVTPGVIVTSPPIQTSSSIKIGSATSKPVRRSIGSKA